ncbi:MAG: SAM-dependent methyltransferase [Solirubrobacteraceae bacterium]
MNRRPRPAEIEEFLSADPSLDALRDAYPDDWAAVQREIGTRLAEGGAGALRAYVQSLASPNAVQAGKGRVKRQEASASAQIRQHIAAETVRRMCISTATGVTSGTVRFNLVNGWIAQRLLFRGAGLERKPVSMTRFGLTWPLLTQRRFLMPLVQPRGIYCFYSKPLVRELARLIDDRPCLEIAAGDGTLSRFLRARGVDITAIDDHSWKNIATASDVVEEDAATALRRRRPRVVVCSWPPAGNAFERHVFTTDSVEQYIVIGSRHEFAAGNWVDYRRQSGFTVEEQPHLGRLVLPPELESAVYLFDRKQPA